ncbi:MAG: NAD-glutamate dehydrogenase, partial [Steroidobacteraceae bacterium]
MPIAIPAARHKLIERIATQTRRFRKRGPSINSADFVRQYYHGVAEEDLAQYPSEELAAAALSHLRFAAVRKAPRPLVRIYNPEEASDGWSSRHTIVELTAGDMPFLVDSLGMVLTQAGLTIHMMVHPVLAVRRDRAGRLVELAPADRTNGQLRRESWQHIQIDRTVDEDRLREIEHKIMRTLNDVRAAVADWREMRQRATEIAQQIGEQPPTVAAPNEAAEIKALLEWMADNHFTFLGYRQYRLRRGRSEDVLEPIPDTGLGILRPRRGSKPQPTPLKG